MARGGKVAERESGRSRSCRAAGGTGRHVTLILEKLIARPAALVSGEARQDGGLLRFESKSGAFSGERAALAATCSELTRMVWGPVRGWLHSGGDWTAVWNDNHWAMLRTTETEFLESPSLALDEIASLSGVGSVYERAAGREPVVLCARIDLPPDGIQLSHELVGTMSATFDGMARAFSRLTGTTNTPRGGWLYSGGHWTAAVGPGRWAMGDAREADLGRLYGAVLDKPSGDVR